jgi:quinoprotein glucose dehydrogenase
MTLRSLFSLLIAALLAAGCSQETTDETSTPTPTTPLAQVTASPDTPDGDWRTINRDEAATRFSPLDQIDASNVADLEQSWTYQLGGNSTAVPIVIDGIMYLPSRDRVVAVDAANGDEVWSWSLPPAEASGPGGNSVSTRGVAWWGGNETEDPRILVMSRSRMIALSAATGEPVASFGDNGIIDVGVPFGGVPTIAGNVAVIGAAVNEVPQGPPGNPRAFDVVTGEKLWEFRTVPAPGEAFNDTWGDGWEDRSGTNMWAFSAPVDLELNLVFLPIAGPAPNYYGGGRPGANVYGNSIVAVDLNTGEYRWHFQTVHHDIWDIDASSGGAFVAVTRDGETTNALAYVGKSSYVFVLDRETGTPFHEVEERPVPAGDVPTEYYHPTQPFPVAPPPLSRVSFTPGDVVTAEQTTAAHADACLEFMERSGGFANAGPFTPFNYKAPGDPPKSTIQFPGGTGGVNWGGITVDPRTGIFYANAQETSLVGWVQDKDPDETYSFEAVGSRQPYDRASINGVGPFHSFTAPISGEYDENGRPAGPSAPCQQPPWGSLVAVNANTGEIVWRSVLGINEDLPEGKQLVGNSGSAGPTATAGGLVFVGATRDSRFRAFDAANGEELWVTQLANSANANPMSYLDRNGQQHVAVIAGDIVYAFSLDAN